ncbi:MAG: AAA family ATPase, partial [Chloroflexota bacterium]|nr:AAA family ATPase [Chloroflexota bacterium]
MSGHEDGIVGREREKAALDSFLDGLRESRGGLVLVPGEAGVGKTRLVEDALVGGDFLALRGAGSQEGALPYGPIVAALRSYLRSVPDGLGDCGPLSPYLALLLPELGPPPEGSDRGTLSEALCCAFRTIARRQPTVVFLDDLHWADHTTLELLPALVASLEHEPLLIIGTYRSDEIPRGHPLRRMRTDLRRAGRLREILAEPLDAEQTSTLAARILGRAPAPALGSMLYDRTQGVPFFIEELASALISGGRIRYGERGAEFDSDEVLPLPETVRDAILLRMSGISEAARAALEVAAVVGFRFDLEVVAELADTVEGVEEAIDHGFISELEQGLGGFRHALVREALYGEVGWARRRALHRRIAERLEADGAPAGVVAEHWIAARELGRARDALAKAAEASCVVHAYRDAARAARRALDIWPEGEDEAMRLGLVDRLGQCTELSGDLGEAARAWREVAEGRHAAGDAVRAAEAERRLAGVYELQGMWERAIASRQAAAANFATGGRAGEAAAEWLAVAAHLHTGGSFAAALEFVSIAAREADRSGRRDLKARALGLMGATEAKLGRIEEGLRLVREGLALALEHSLTGPAAECYQRLATVLENAADYSGARDAYAAAIDFCQVRGLSGPAQVCLACLAYILRQTGDWGRGADLCRGVLHSADAPINARITASGMLGWIHTSRGETRLARRLLVE